ncbi:MAG TPA: DNA (cytosine-5-)-methyltransferase, partial [Desulfobacteraceae bacterium]|nr:DNA (cytosine-5-)-methyltransferase [Desulfobacteraceae bacterium]
MKYFSMFSGIGGFDIPLVEMGHKCVGHSEIDKYAEMIYRKNIGGKNYGDVTRIEWTEVNNFDLLCAGFPCQAFSIAGKREGFNDTRGTLFFEIAKCLDQKQPSYCL